MREKNHKALVLASVVLVSVMLQPTLLPQAFAAHVSCGSTITTSTVLDSDIGPCPGDGITITASNISLDCAGHKITGQLGFQTGIHLLSVSRVIVSNCRVYNFSSQTLLLTSSSNNTIQDGFLSSFYGDPLKLLSSNQNVFSRVNFTQGFAFRVQRSSNNMFRDGEISRLAYPVLLTTDSPPSNNNTFLNMTFRDNGQPLEIGFDSNKIIRSKIMNSPGIDINTHVFGVSNALVEENLITSNLGGGDSGQLAAIRVRGGTGHNITRNQIVTNGVKGLELLTTSGNFIYGNNIYSNPQPQVFSDAPVEVSFNGQGNYWGRTTAPCFVAGTDSNAADVVDSFASCAELANIWVSAPPDFSISVNPSSLSLNNPTIEVLPYQATGYRYNVYSTGTVPSNFGAVDFDDSGFAIGDAAFGSGGGCPLQANMRTVWTAGSEIVVRRTITLGASASNLRIFAVVDNDIRIAVNGVDISGGLVQHEECPSADDFFFKVPDSLLVEGQNLLAIHARDRGAESFLDARLFVDEGDSQTSTITVTSLNGFQGPVSLGVAVSPGGPDAPVATLSSQVVNLQPAGSGTSILTLSTTPQTPSGSYALTITGSSSALIHSSTIQADVLSPDFAITASSSSITIRVPQIGTLTVQLVSLNGFLDLVTLSFTISPQEPNGPAVTLSPSAVRLYPGQPVSLLLTISGVESTTSQTYTITVIGTSGDIVHSISNTAIVTVTVGGLEVPTNLLIPFATFLALGISGPVVAYILFERRTSRTRASVASFASLFRGRRRGSG